MTLHYLFKQELIFNAYHYATLVCKYKINWLHSI